MSAHTPGPWRWEVNLKSRNISLCGGVPRFDLTVMDFTRWGMGSARPRLLTKWDRSGLMLMESAERFAVPVPGREHHADWFQALNHPDAHLIAAAPELLAALKDMVAPVPDGQEWALVYVERQRAAHAAIAKAEGR